MTPIERQVCQFFIFFLSTLAHLGLMFGSDAVHLVQLKITLFFIYVFTFFTRHYLYISAAHECEITHTHASCARTHTRSARLSRTRGAFVHFTVMGRTLETLIGFSSLEKRSTCDFHRILFCFFFVGLMNGINAFCWFDAIGFWGKCVRPREIHWRHKK